MWAVATSLALPRPALAQASILEGFAKALTDFNLFVGAGGLTSRSGPVAGGKHGFNIAGFELSLSIGSLSCIADVPNAGSQPLSGDSAAAGRVRELTRALYTEEIKPCAIAAQIARMRMDSAAIAGVLAKTHQPALPMPRDTAWNFELGLGYSQLDGFRSSSATGNVAIAGAINEVPVISFYATDWHVPYGLYLYAGARLGFVQLSNFSYNIRASQTDSITTYSASASGLEEGAVLGIGHDIGVGTLFVEGAYTFRRLPGLSWSLTSKGSLPPLIPLSLNLSGSSLSLGVQIPVYHQPSQRGRDG